MEESIKQLWAAFMWYAGLSASMTLWLLGWIIKIQRSLRVREDTDERIKRIQYDVDEIKTALKGDYEKKGLVTRYHELEKKVEHLESSRP